MFLTLLVIANLQSPTCKWVAPLQPQYEYCTNGTTERMLTARTVPIAAPQITVKPQALEPALNGMLLQNTDNVYRVQAQTGGNGQNIELQPALGYNDFQ